MHYEGDYYFARLNLIFAHQMSKYDFLTSSFNKNISISSRDYEWGFFNIKVFEYEDEKFISGQLVKFKTSDEDDIVDKKEKKTDYIKIENKINALSTFIFHPKTSIIAYHPRTNKIGYKQFGKMFCKLIEKANDNFFVNAELQFIDEEMKIKEAIRNFDKINKLTIILHPSNPRTRPIWKDTDTRMQNMKAEKYKQIYSTKGESGLIIKENNNPYTDIIMAGDGYGKTTIFGEKNGQKHTASTDNIPVKIKAFIDEEVEIIIDTLYNKFKQLWDRVKKNENKD